MTVIAVLCLGSTRLSQVLWTAHKWLSWSVWWFKKFLTGIFSIPWRYWQVFYQLISLIKFVLKVVSKIGREKVINKSWKIGWMENFFAFHSVKINNKANNKVLKRDKLNCFDKNLAHCISAGVTSKNVQMFLKIYPLICKCQKEFILESNNSTHLQLLFTVLL